MANEKKLNRIKFAHFSLNLNDLPELRNEKKDAVPLVPGNGRLSQGGYYQVLELEQEAGTNLDQ